MKTLSIGLSCGFALLSFTGCVTDQELRAAERRLEEQKAELEVIKAGPKIEDPATAWMCGPRPPNREFNLANGECIEMIGVPCGTFVMGTPEPEMGWNGDGVGHKVTLTEPFWIGKFPLTVAQCRFLLPFEQSDGKRNFLSAYPSIQYDKFDPDWDEDMLTWDDAQRIVAQMNLCFAGSLPEGYHFALPTEAQWEYACRAGTVTAYNNGKKPTLVKRKITLQTGEKRIIDEFAEICPNLDEVAWYSGNAQLRRHRVGGKKPNAWGIYDMHGLCSEWCQDFYSDDLEKGSVNMINPVGPKTGKGHVHRGGGYGFAPCYLTSYHRMNGSQFPRSDKLPKALWGKPSVAGMRLALVKEAPEAVDLADTKLYGKNYKTVCAWQQKQLEEVSVRDQAVLEPIQKKAAYLPLIKFALQAFEVAQPALEVYMNAQIGKAFGVAPGTVAANGTSAGDTPSGFGTIKGPSSLSRGQTATYSLYVGGKKITSGVNWSQGGTSISVYGAGDHARAQAGNPPVKTGFYRSGIRATFNGKTYSKMIQIAK